MVLLTVGEGAASSRELAKTLGVPVAGNLPADPKTAAVLSDGLGSRSRLQAERPLILAAAAVGRGLPGRRRSAARCPASAASPSTPRTRTGRRTGPVPGQRARLARRAALDGYPAADGAGQHSRHAPAGSPRRPAVARAAPRRLPAPGRRLLSARSALRLPAA